MAYHLILIEPLSSELFDVLVYKSDTGIIPSPTDTLDADRVVWVAREVSPDRLSNAVADARAVPDELDENF